MPSFQSDAPCQRELCGHALCDGGELGVTAPGDQKGRHPKGGKLGPEVGLNAEPEASQGGGEPLHRARAAAGSQRLRQVWLDPGQPIEERLALPPGQEGL